MSSFRRRSQPSTPAWPTSSISPKSLNLLRHMRKLNLISLSCGECPNYSGIIYMGENLPWCCTDLLYAEEFILEGSEVILCLYQVKHKNYSLVFLFIRYFHVFLLKFLFINRSFLSWVAWWPSALKPEVLQHCQKVRRRRS